MTTNDKNGQQPEARNISPPSRPTDREGAGPLSDADLDQVAGGAKLNEDPEMRGQVYKK